MIMALTVISYLDGKISAIDIVSQEEVSCVRGVSSDFKQLHQIIVLTMDIAANYNQTAKANIMSVIALLLEICPSFHACKHDPETGGSSYL
jgi:hypothetical protein